jgi:O-antigen/teichoic acid export membrane protein
MIISTIISTILVVIVSRQFVFKISELKIDAKILNELLLFGLPLVPANLLSWVLNSFDKVALRTWSSFEELGLYAAAFKIVSLLVIFQSIFTITWTPVAYKWYEDGVPFEQFEDVSSIVLSIMTIVFAFIVVFRTIIIMVLGPEYRETSSIFVFLLFVPVMYTVSETTRLGISFLKKNIYTLYISIIVAMLNLIGNFLLVPKYGATGAAVSTSVSYIVFFWFRTLFSRKLWFKMKLNKFVINISFLILFGVNMLAFNKYYFDIIILLLILLFNMPVLWKMYLKYYYGKK